jgi:hypothetical protein
MKHIDDFFQTQSLLIWNPGNMGAFLMNFLEASKPHYNAKLDLKKLGMLESKEWQYSDYFMGYYNNSFHKYQPETFAELKRIEKIICDYYGKENVGKYISYLIALLNQVVNNLTTFDIAVKSVPVLKEIKTIQNLYMFLMQYIDDIKYNYVKLHPHHGIPNGIPWKEKIYCYFPENKDWMRFVLHFYKLSMYPTIKSNTPYYDDSVIFMEKVNAILNNSLVFVSDFIGVENIRNDPTFTHVNIYDFLFKDGYTKLVNDMTPDQEKVLRLGKESTLEILDFFNLKHELELPGNVNLNQIPEFETFRNLVKQYYKK